MNRKVWNVVGSDSEGESYDLLSVGFDDAGEPVVESNGASISDKSKVSVSETGTATDKINYITVDGTEKKIGGTEVSVSATGTSTDTVEYITINGDEKAIGSKEIIKVYELPTENINDKAIYHLITEEKAPTHGPATDGTNEGYHFNINLTQEEIGTIIKNFFNAHPRNENGDLYNCYVVCGACDDDNNILYSTLIYYSDNGNDWGILWSGQDWYEYLLSYYYGDYIVDDYYNYKLSDFCTNYYPNTQYSSSAISIIINAWSSENWPYFSGFNDELKELFIIGENQNNYYNYDSTNSLWNDGLPLKNNEFEGSFTRKQLDTTSYGINLGWSSLGNSYYGGYWTIDNGCLQATEANADSIYLRSYCGPIINIDDINYTITNYDKKTNMATINPSLVKAIDESSKAYFISYTYQYSMSEGLLTAASGYSSHSEGCCTKASNNAAHAEGNNTTASGNYSHAEGYETTASSQSSHAEGIGTAASGRASHTEGNSTTANSDCQHVQGQYNVIDSAAKYVDIVGWGTSNSARKNISALGTDGTLHLAGQVVVGCSSNSTGGTQLAPIPTAPTTAGTYTLEVTVTSAGVATYTWVAKS